MKKICVGIASIAALLVVWQVIVLLKMVDPLFLPAPAEVAQVFWKQLFVSSELWFDAAATLGRTVTGFLIGALVGVALGVLMGWSARVYSALEFPVDFMRSVPATTLFPLFLVFFGIGDEAKVAVVIWACSLIVMVNTVYGVRHASKLRQMVAKTMGAKKLDLLRKVILPDAAPHIFAGLRIALSFSLVVVVVTEMFMGTQVGLGRRIIDASLVYQVPEMYAAILLTGIIGFLLNKAFLTIERRAVHWSGK